MSIRRVSAPVLITFSILLLITIWRICYLNTIPFDLFFDEAQYWFWSKNPDWGYYSKPPVVAWAIWVTTSVCGDGENCIRLMSPLLHLGTAIIIYCIAQHLYDKKIAALSAISYLTLPAVTLSSALVSTDPALLFFYGLSLYCFIRAADDSGKWKWWVLSGLAAGLGMLSKYNMLLFLVSAIFYLCFTKEKKHLLKSQGFWTSVFIAFLIFLPNILWNIQHQFASFAHTKDNANLTGPLFHPEELLEFIGAQFGVFGPIYFLVLLLVLFSVKHLRQHSHAGLLISFILPMLITILTISLLSRAHANWAAPMYVPATILVISWLVKNNKQWLIWLSLSIHVLVFIGFIYFIPLTEKTGLRLSGEKTDLSDYQIRDPFLRVRGWSELGHQVTAILDQHPQAALLTLSRQIHAELLYYTHQKAPLIIKWNIDNTVKDHFELTTDISNAPTGEFILIAHPGSIPDLKPWFKYHKRLDDITLPLYADHTLTFEVYFVAGYKGI